MDSYETEARRPVVARSHCKHTRVVSPALCWEEVRRRQTDGPECDTCAFKGEDLWLCLVRGCSYIGCGVNSQLHNKVHGTKFHHHLTVSLSTFELWCFTCEQRVFPGFNYPPFNIPEVVTSSSLATMAHLESSSTGSPQRGNSASEESDSDMEDDCTRPRGLTGLQNLGNTCYLNSALQALSNCPPLTRYFLKCQGLVRTDRNPSLSRSYAKLMSELWHKKRLSYVTPSGVVSGIKAVHPMFRGYTQQDAQEFLRCFMDQLHEELKYPVEDDEEDGTQVSKDDMSPESGIASPTDPSSQSLSGSLAGGGDLHLLGGPDRKNSMDSSSSEGEEYETCDSGLSSEMSSQADHNASSDDSNSEVNEQTLCLSSVDTIGSCLGGSGDRNPPTPLPCSTSPGCLNQSRVRQQQNKNRNSFSSLPAEFGSGFDTVANLKEIKETANLLSKKETDNARNMGFTETCLQKCDSGEYLDALCDSSAPATNTRARTVAAAVSLQQHLQQHLQQQQLQPEMTAARSVPMLIPLPRKGRKRKQIQYQSIISQIFDGKILSSVQCLYCERVSTTKETFQDLSLPIPSKDYLQVLHSGHPGIAASGGRAVGGPRGGACGDQLGSQSWLNWMFSWMKSFFVGPTITLQNCLSAFFSADELKGDNMYSCEQCKKLRNGLKYSKVLELPEILSIHLKRFRHEFCSTKISTYISFPLHGLDMKPYLHKDCKNEVTVYDLVAVVCHHGTAGGGHYTAYCLNYKNECWYEFDDCYVTEVDVGQVVNCEAYVLFYRKCDDSMMNVRLKAIEMDQKASAEPSLLKFFVSRQWIHRFYNFAEPGPISNRDFLCKHGGVPPHKVNYAEESAQPLEQSVWDLLYHRFGGGPVCNRLVPCQPCHEELEVVKHRQHWEMEMFLKLNEEFNSNEKQYAQTNALSMVWFKEWEAFVRDKSDNLQLLIPPGPVDNSRIVQYRSGQASLRPSSDYGQLSPDMYNFFVRIYGGGPEVAIIPQRSLSASQSSTTVSSSPTPPVKESSLSASPSPSSASLSPNPSPPINPSIVVSSPSNCSTTVAYTTTADTTTAADTTSTQPMEVDALLGENVESASHDSPSSSSASTLTHPGEESRKRGRGEESAGGSGESGEEDGGQSSRPSGLVVSRQQQLRGIPQPMDVTRL